MNQARMIKVSKFLSRHLRHQPERLGLTLGRGGWVLVEDLLAGCARVRFPLTREELDGVVARNDKQRFSFDLTGQLIRANQGHTVDVDLGLDPVVPPDVLYHGTKERSLRAITEHGLRKMSRHHVHLSPDVSTARTVGSRHGQPVVLQVHAARMHEAGHTFYRSANGVWLVDHVPPKYLSRA